MKCSLCHSTQISEVECIHNISYWSCNKCGSWFKHPRHHITPEAEKNRYLQHNNEVTDSGYQKFVQPVVQRIQKNHSPASNGLDFGAGTGPVATNMLRQFGFENIQLYDPFFYPDDTLSNGSYSFILCIEVIEHFHRPYQEFDRLFSLLQTGGKLYCMTHLLPDPERFKDWYYKNDSTHVFFYNEENLSWIKNHFGFNHLEVEDRCIVFTK